MTWERSVRRTVIALVFFAPAAFAVVLALPHLNAQSQPTPSNSDRKPDAETIQTFYLANGADTSELNDIQTSLRNMIPKARIYGVSSQSAITLRGTSEDLDAAQKLIAALDRPRSVYRLTYTITDIDAGKRTGSQHFVLLAVAGQRSTFKQGSRVPIVTGIRSERGDASNQSSQVQYVDTGLNIDATITGSPNALNLRSKIEQTSPTVENSAATAHNQRFRQTVLDESFQLAQGKPLVLGSFDLPGTTRHQEIEVVAEPVR